MAPVALFPQCGFELEVGDLVAGTTAPATLVLQVPRPIVRAERLHLAFRSEAQAGYGSGKSRTVVRREILTSPFQVELPKGTPLPAGNHRYPFSFDVPKDLPPALFGDDCSIYHHFRAVLVVDWARDPSATFVPAVRHAPTVATRVPITVRSPSTFHDRLVVELTLASNLLALDEPIVGRLALRGGADVRFNSVVLTLVAKQRVVMGQDDVRTLRLGSVRAPADSLRRGEPLPFLIPPHVTTPSVDNAFIAMGYAIEVRVDVPFRFDPVFEVPITLLPRGSQLYDASDVVTAVGGERLRLIAAELAQRTGLRAGTPPVLATGRVGPIDMRLTDAPRDGILGVDVTLSFPSLALGTAFRPMGLLDGFRESPLLPEGLSHRYFLRASPAAGKDAFSPETLKGLFATLLAQAHGADDVHLADHHLGMHFRLRGDDASAIVELGTRAYDHAKAIGAALDALPFPPAVADAEAAWRGTASEEDATVVPSGPSLHGVFFRARVLTGEERAARTTFETVWRDGAPSTRVLVDFGDAPLPREAWATLSSPSDAAPHLAPLRAAFATATVASEGRVVTLEASSFAADPRSTFPALRALFLWALEVRSERRVDAPYR